ncbi:MULTISPECIES: hypothetical protein [unclassified Pseudomonas]|uniref:hypothetical protein n=1 Tax=unclassified Pseudomonas TaxID=196821 RepID=UPI002AC975CC|nr:MULTISPECIES: hypothetical protein [unclassified Pseudomonas]MEB0045955.1 hypothetical protein [Pseudomonas sp. Dout3]MEB0097215.1 hypothetical protein [Pseudomonas sp. DC1.2]WPX56847.1 hypothetical protein RHM68_14380 [Pseudomonas sp. DC1.2]
MCILSHFSFNPCAPTSDSSAPTAAAFQHTASHLQPLAAPRFQVVLAGNAFFHIKEKSTGRVRGFRGNHNEACFLARALEASS